MDNFQTDLFRHSFFIDSVIKCNHLPDSIVHADSVEGFKSALLICDLFCALSPGVYITEIYYFWSYSVHIQIQTDTDQSLLLMTIFFQYE